ncbi:hypothetical protein KIH41_15220 [Litoribacter ruber]|uniref:Uncharacterized protein n=1 Tax=Litoribacter ruber TaxID=702568 RepID=A0AAP2G1J8_9BACT|nr:hypothetical protein [Litoribacter alkaliphilus]MBT0812638.1 hypothetical protein [Litoribacter ruber]
MTMKPRTNWSQLKWSFSSSKVVQTCGLAKLSRIEEDI